MDLEDDLKFAFKGVRKNGKELFIISHKCGVDNYFLFFDFYKARYYGWC